MQRMVAPPVAVQVTFTKTSDGCDIDYTPAGPITLYKNADNGPNRAIWTWTGADYDRAWVVFEATDMKSCLDGHFVKDSKQGFEIIMPGGTTKTVNSASDCRRGTYNYELRAVSAGGDVCGVDPGVIIEN